MKLETILSPEYVEKYQSIWPNKTILDYLNEAISEVSLTKWRLSIKRAVTRIVSSGN